MRFVVDAHLPPGLCDLLQAAGHDALHTRQLSAQNRTTDEALNTLSVNEQRVVITKDTDFYYSHVLHGKPWKLLLVRTGNIRTRDLKALFERHLSEVVAALEQNSLVELDRQTVRVII
jgi:predicted nuclease of predicted toxin-antitoxin system